MRTTRCVRFVSDRHFAISREEQGNRRKSLPHKADGVGFEPTDACTSPVFKTGAFDHSATRPGYRLVSKMTNSSTLSPKNRPGTCTFETFARLQGSESAGTKMSLGLFLPQHPLTHSNLLWLAAKDDANYADGANAARTSTR